MAINNVNTDFKMFGRVLRTREEFMLSEEKAANFYKEKMRKIVEPPELQLAYNGLCRLTTIEVEKMPIDWIQRAIQEKMSKLKEEYNDFVMRSKIQNEIEALENGFARISPHDDCIDSIGVDIVHPFLWEVNIAHEKPFRPEYEYSLRSDELFINLSVTIYKIQNANKYLVETHRKKGRSYVYIYLQTELSKCLSEKEDLYKIYKERVPILLLSEGLGLLGFNHSSQNVVRYFLNELIVKEVCSYIW